MVSGPVFILWAEKQELDRNLVDNFLPTAIYSKCKPPNGLNAESQEKNTSELFRKFLFSRMVNFGLNIRFQNSESEKA